MTTQFTLATGSTLTLNGASSGLIVSAASGATTRLLSATGAVTINWKAPGGNGLTFKGFNSGAGSSGGVLSVFGDLAGGISGSTFTGNQAIFGGAVYVGSALTGGISGSTFSGNQAGGSGGALYVFGDLAGGISGSTFSGNQAGGSGGALYVGGDLDNISGNSKFADNQAKLAGGALFAGGNLAISDATFTNNKAAGDATKPTSGRGGAIFHNGGHLAGLPYKNVSLDVAAGQSIIFEGNTMNPGKSGETPNSIYFGNSWIGAGNDGTTTAAFNVATGGTLKILDPLASQPDDLPSGNPFFPTYPNLTLLINKTGTGTMVLAGNNDMQSAADWTVSAGTLHLVADKDGKPAIINLANTSNKMNAANPARFTLKSGASLLLEPASTAHKINGQVINFESGSKVGVAGFKYGPVMDSGQHTVLTLNAPSLTNQSSVPVTTGSITIGAMNYKYSNLVWDAARKNLIMTIGDAQPDPILSGAPALTGTSAIGIYNPAFNAFNTRAVNAFRSLPGFEGAGIGIVNPEDEVSLNTTTTAPAAGDAASRDLANSLWLTPYFSAVNNSGDTDYDIRTPGLAFGYERQLCDRAFAGLGVSLFWPDYSGSGTDIDAFDVTFALYGGLLLPWELELDARVGYGFTDYDQTRHVRGHRYSDDYNGNTFFAGLGLGRTFSFNNGFYLRPGARYDYIHLSTDGFDEGDGLFALNVDDYDQNLHRVKAGLEAGYEAQNGLRLAAEAYYLGLYGDRRARASAHFTADPVNGFTAIGDALDENNLGLGARASYSVNEQWELGAGYNAIIGKDTISNEINMDVTFRF